MNDKIRCTVGLSVERDGERVLDLSIGPVATRQEIQAAMCNLRNLLNKYGPAPETPETSEPDTEAEAVPVTPATPLNPLRGAKGFLILQCDRCGSQFVTYPKDYITSALCRCGHKIDLTAPLARLEYECSSCNRTWRGKINSTQPRLDIVCRCGNPISLTWDKKLRLYKGDG